MKQSIIIIVSIVLTVLLASFALAETDPLDYEDLQLRTDIRGSVEIIPVEADYYVTAVNVNLSWVPDSTFRQELIHIETDPEARIDETINFAWKTPTNTALDFSVLAGTKGYNAFEKVYEKKAFPAENLGGDYYVYLKPSNISDITPEIKDLASSLVEDEDDLYGAVMNIGVWVEKNIEYDLSTITAEASQKSSWVLANKRGVCDEITSLFISMCRAVGIPARFVSGIAYTNVGSDAGTWGPHGWAEVYFPNVGWVPFDVTYKEFGYLDATHISLETSIDAQGTLMQFSASGKNINIDSSGITTETQIIGKGDLLKSIISLQGDVYKPKVGFGSYNMITVTAKNLQSYYVPITLKLGTPVEVSVVGEDEKTILLKPSEQKKVYFVVKVDGSLKEGYKYTFPLIIQERRKGSVTAEFEADASTGILELEQFENIISSEEEAQAKPYSANVTLNCTADKNALYLEDALYINCTAENKGEKILAYSAICFEDSCYNTRIPANGNESTNFTKTFDSVGIKTLMFTAQNKDFAKTSYLVVNVMDKPSLSILNITYPEKLGFDETGTIQFILHKNSDFPPQNAKITITHDLFEKEWALQDVKQNNVFQLEFQGKNLKLRDNVFKVNVEYWDDKGNVYSDGQEFEVEVTTKDFVQKLLLLINSWEFRLEKFFS